MDGLSLMDRYQPQPHIPYHGIRSLDVKSQQLPMPIFRGRLDTFEDSRRRSAATSPAARLSVDISPSSSNFLDAPHHRQSYTDREQAPLHSSTQQSGDSRPSLPSLRTVLGENARSPPSSPHHYGSSAQPQPREPFYDHSFYKPSSLYPNKRTRTDSGWDGEVADRKKVESTLPSITTQQSDRSVHHHHQHHPRDLPMLNDGSPDYYRYRHSESHFDDRSSARESLSHHASPIARGRSINLASSPRIAPLQSYEIPTRTTHQFSFSSRSTSARDHQVDSTTPSAYGSISAHSRSPSVAVGDDGAHRASAYNHPNTLQQPFQQESRHHSLLPAGHSPGFRDDFPALNRMDGPQGYNTSPYPYSQAFFVPSHYEYQHGKSRKRSNLPKQSTEIMKRWFDENLQNPYPSEEQKRHFAAVAGINLTQVSNWFINHRRRCPELREKRDKGRAGSRDDSV